METLRTKIVSIVSLPVMNEVSDVKKRILEQSLQLFIQYGIRSVSMDDLASEVGVSKKTIYHYYKDKNQLVEEAVIAILNKNFCDCEETREIAKNAIEESFMLIQQSDEFFSMLNPLILYDLKKYHTKGYEKFLEYKDNQLYNMLKANIEWGIKDGLFREDINVELITIFRLETIITAFLPDFQSKVHLSIKEIHKELFYLFMSGIATKKGYTLIDKLKQKREKK